MQAAVATITTRSPSDTRKAERIVIDVCRGVAPPFDPHEATEQYANLAKEYGCLSVVGRRLCPGVGRWRLEQVRCSLRPQRAAQVANLLGMLAVIRARLGLRCPIKAWVPRVLLLPPIIKICKFLDTVFNSEVARPQRALRPVKPPAAAAGPQRLQSSRKSASDWYQPEGWALELPLV